MSNLVDGFVSAFGLELLSTVHWVIEHNAPATRDEVIARTCERNEGENRFSLRQIEMAVDVLTAKGWSGD